jgi:hypothetical protein
VAGRELKRGAGCCELEHLDANDVANFLLVGTIKERESYSKGNQTTVHDCNKVMQVKIGLLEE